MATQTYLPKSQAGINSWLENFADKLPGYASTFGFTNGETAAITKGQALFAYLYGLQVGIRTYGKSVTGFTKITMEGGGSPTALPVLNVGTPPPDLEFNVLGQVRALVQRIKTHPAYTPVIGADLGIIGTEIVENPATWQPQITATVLGGQVQIGWGWEGHNADAAELEVDRGTGLWGPLFTDTNPDYTDPTPMPPLPQVWKYRAIYIKGGVRVGLFSEPMLVAVGGPQL